MTTTPTSSAYLRLLTPWLSAAERQLYRPPDRPDLLCYGTGYNGWGVQTHQKAFAALAVLAADPTYDAARAGITREALTGRALAMLRFSLASHHAGGYHCTDGTPWGHTWISALGVERMMHGVEALASHLTDADQALLRAALISESDWLLDHYDILAGPVQHNKPESNLWNGALLHRTALWYPDAPRAAAYREKGTRFLVNGISVADDATSDIGYDGRPVSAWFIGENFFPSYALNHHGYLNIGYMAICLSNVAMLHFTYRQRGLEAPAALYHHARELWALVKACTFPDGRLLRIGGDTRVRYSYCQDYAIPMWLLASAAFDDPHAAAFEAGWLEQVAREMASNGDGSFLSSRCAELASVSPLYYTRLEADRAVTLSMGAYWRRVAAISEAITPPPPTTVAWHDPYHGAVYQRGPARVASWTWLAGERPQGLCLPGDGSDLAEWRECLAGRILGQGRLNERVIVAHEERLFDGGFLTWGEARGRSSKMLAEGQEEDETAVQRLVAAALPDDATLLVLQHAVAPARRVYLTGLAGINLPIPNDLFNGNHRTYHVDGETVTLAGVGSAEALWPTGSRWMNVEDRLGIIGLYGMEQLYLHRPGTRQIGLKSWAHFETWQAGGMLYADEVVAPWRQGLWSVAPGEVLCDLGVAVQANVPHETTARLCRDAAAVATDSPAVRAVRVTGRDGHAYLLAANLADTPARPGLALPEAGVLTDLVTGESIAATDPLPLPAAGARLFRLER